MSKKLTNSQKKKYCIGCRQNFYNGNNSYAIKECWNLKDAKVWWRKIYLKPSDIKPTKIRTLSCWMPKR